MSLLATLFHDVTFYQVALSLIALGIIERIMLLLPETVVGENGWLLRIRETDA